jgi:hypothetical protein
VQGKSICIASVFIEKAMSAIIRAYTLDGFVVFADGRSTPVDPSKVVSDETQKIFNVTSISGPLSIGIVGTAQIDTAEGLCVDLTRLFTDSAGTLRSANVVDFGEYGKRLSDPVMHEIMTHHSGNFGAIEDGDLLNVFVDGFINGQAGSVHIRIFAENHTLIREIEPLKPCWQPYIHGADKLAASMFIGNGMIPRTYSGPVGALMNSFSVTGMACAYIHACGEQHNIEAEPFCAKIGGHIHGAVVGPTGFRWIDGFKPVGA